MRRDIEGTETVFFRNLFFFFSSSMCDGHHGARLSRLPNVGLALGTHSTIDLKVLHTQTSTLEF